MGFSFLGRDVAKRQSGTAISDRQEEAQIQATPCRKSVEMVFFTFG